MKTPTKDQVAQARKDAGLTQAQAAELCCVSKSAYQHWEHGRRQMPRGSWELLLMRLEQK